MSGPSVEDIQKEVRARRAEILEMAMELVRFPSENRPPDGAEGTAQEFVARACRELGLEVDEFTPPQVDGIEDHPSWLQGRNYPPERRDVVGVWKGSGGGRSLLLSGHVDVGPFEPDDWQVTGPFEPVVREGRLYGRGAADMKGGLAAAFMAVKLLRDIGFEPRGDLIFESVVDEEFAGGNGTLAARLRGYNADLAVLTEPTRMELCTASLGAFLGHLTLRGRAGMPYMGMPIPNPILGAARAVELFSRWQEEWREANAHPLFTEPGKELNVVLWNVSAATPGSFVQLGVPSRTRIDWIVWCYPGITEEEFYRRFNQYWREAEEKDELLGLFLMEIGRDFHHVRSWQTDSESEAVQCAARAYREVTGVRPSTGGAPFSCDMALYGEHMPVIILGPRGDNLHAPDEWVEVEDLYSLTAVFARLAASWCG